MNSYEEKIIVKNIRNLHFSLRLLAVAIIILMIFEYMLETKLKAIRYDVNELKERGKLPDYNSNIMEASNGLSD